MASNPTFSMIPANDPPVSAGDELDAAAAGAVAAPVGQQIVDDPPPRPFGRTWIFDFETGAMVRLGSSPAETTHFGALTQWCLMALHSALGAHAVFSDEFGMDEPDSLLGHFAIGEALADWQAALVEALMVHDRITAVQNFDMTWDPVEGVLSLDSFDVVTDEDEIVTVSGVTLRAGGNA